MNEGMASRVIQTRRCTAEVARFFDGLELVEPSVISPHRWRPDPGEPNTEVDMPARCGYPTLAVTAARLPA